MTQLHEVLNPIINSPYAEPTQHYVIRPGEPAELRAGRRPAMYYYRPPNRQGGRAPSDDVGTPVELDLVNELRRRVGEWRRLGYPGVTRTTDELLRYWQRPERHGSTRLFFCQREAAETIIFLTEARADVRQGLDIPRDEPGEEARARGYTAFLRYACKMATGSGKTTVMGMLAAWSILNKVNDRSDARFSDVVLVLCPNITIRDRLGELDPQRGEASLYRTRDLVPPHLMDELRRGTVIITNWHVLQPDQGGDVAGVPSRAVKKGPQSDTALVKEVLKAAGNRQNILVFNDEAHHAYRLRPLPEGQARESEVWAEAEQAQAQASEATVWLEGLDKIHKVRGINFCLDLSATPYYLNNTGNDPGRPFPWIVSDFGLIDAIECGMVKIPQLPVQDSTGRPIPAYFNVWKWIVEEKLTAGEKGGRRGQINPRAVLKYAHTPIAQLAGLWRETFEEWRTDPAAHPTPPVFIIVCRDTRLARVMYEWIALGEGKTPPLIEEFRNRDGQENTVRIDSRVVEELESGQTKSHETRRLRFVLQTIGKTRWPDDRPPDEWAELARELGVDPYVPPGRDVRCIISVAMLTEGWDATTVTHIVGLRPFESQLLCEQVVGRGLRRSRYDVLDCERVEDIPEEEARVYGVPFEIIPFKTPPRGPAPPRARIYHVHALPERAALEIRFPRVERYTYAIRSRIRVDWDAVPRLILDPTDIPPEVTVKGLSWTAGTRPTLYGPGRMDLVTLRAWRQDHRLQELEFELARTLTRTYAQSPECQVPPQALFPQMLRLVQRFVQEKVEPRAGYDRRDLFLNPYYGWAVETLTSAIRPDAEGGEPPEVPVYEEHRGPGSTADVDFWTAREPQDVVHSHLNRVVPDTRVWEQSAAFYLDRHENVAAFAKNEGLGFAIPYLHNGEYHEYVPDFLARLVWQGREVGTLILETKGYDPLDEVKRAAALRWVAAVNHDGQYGRWAYRLVHRPSDVPEVVRGAAEEMSGG